MATLPNAIDAQIEFSYAPEADSYMGSKKKETYDIAIYLPGEAFEGFDITGITVPVNAQGGTDGYSDPKIWLTSELILQSKVNVPDIASYDAELSEDGTLSITLPENYTIPDTGVYVGYSITTKTSDSAGTQSPIAIQQGVRDSHGFYMHSSKTYMNWKSYSESLGACSAIKVSLSGDLQDVSVSAIAFPQYIYAAIGEKSSFECILATTAASSLESLEIEYETEGVTGTSECVFSQPVESGIYRKFKALFELPAFTDKFSEEIKFHISRVNGQDNPSTFDTASSILTVYSEAPKHQSLLEEYTGTWCQYCVRGYAALEHMRHHNPDMVAVAYHSGDEMQVPGGFPNLFSGLPTAFINRTVEADPYLGITMDEEGSFLIVEDMKAINEEFTPWEIKVSQEWISESKLRAQADVKCLNKIDGKGYRIGFILVSDGLISPTWQQSNAYSSYPQSDYLIPELNDFCSGGKYGEPLVPGLVYNDVVICKDAIRGFEGDVPSHLEPEQPVTVTYTYDISNNALVQDKGNLRVVALVLDADGKVLNCAKTMTDNEVAGITPVQSYPDTPVEYYDINGIKVSCPSKGLYIQRRGSTFSKVIIQ